MQRASDQHRPGHELKRHGARSSQGLEKPHAPDTIYLCRYLRRVVVADHGHSRALSIARSHNVPAFAQGISGHEMLLRMREQFADLNGRVTDVEVTSLQRHPQGGFVVRSGGLSWLSRTVLLATEVLDVRQLCRGFMPQLSLSAGSTS